MERIKNSDCNEWMPILEKHLQNGRQAVRQRTRDRGRGLPCDVVVVYHEVRLLRNMIILLLA